jgi:CTP synthase
MESKTLSDSIKKILMKEKERNFKEEDKNEKLIENKKKIKFVIFCGSTMSGLGKGTTMSALGFLFQCCGLKVTCIKIDPYLNCDAGTMSPFEHGEVFVLDDGGETDLDLGNYERTLSLRLTKDHNITSGKVLSGVIDEERRGGYIGRTVQMVPHVTNKIKKMILDTAYIPVQKDSDEIADICLVEIGGTVGDLESSIYMEAIRQFMNERESSECALVCITYVPKTDEFKTKPAQHGIRELKSLGIYPNIMVCRSEGKLENETIKKIAFFSDLPFINIINCYNLPSYWDVPLILASQNLHLKLLSHLNLDFNKYEMNKVIGLSEHIRELQTATEVRIAICGKYTKMTDAYYSLNKSLFDASINSYRKIKLEWLDCTVFEPEFENKQENKFEREEFWKKIENCHGILVPGGKYN